MCIKPGEGEAIPGVMRHADVLEENIVFCAMELVKSVLKFEQIPKQRLEDLRTMR